MIIFYFKKSTGFLDTLLKSAWRKSQSCITVFTEIASSELCETFLDTTFASQPPPDVHVYSLLLLKQIVKNGLF